MGGATRCKLHDISNDVHIQVVFMNSHVGRWIVYEKGKRDLLGRSRVEVENKWMGTDKHIFDGSVLI